MARLARVVLPGVPHHVTQRGVRSMEIFSSDKDRPQDRCREEKHPQIPERVLRERNESPRGGPPPPESGVDHHHGGRLIHAISPVALSS